MTDSNFLPIISTDEIWVGEDKTRCLSGYIDNIIYVSSENGVEYTATVDSVNELSAGVNFIMVPNMTSTSTTPTLNVNGFGAKYIRQRLSLNSSATVQGSIESWLVEDRPIRVIYDGMYWVVDFTKPDLNYANGVLPIANGGTGCQNKEEFDDLILDIVGANSSGGGTGSGGTETGGVASHTHNANDITSGTLSSDIIPVIPIDKGGTGATDASSALTNLGAASKSVVDPIANVLSVGDDCVDVSKPIRIENCITASKTDGLNVYDVHTETHSITAETTGGGHGIAVSISDGALAYDNGFDLGGESHVLSSGFTLPSNCNSIKATLSYSTIESVGNGPIVAYLLKGSEFCKSLNVYVLGYTIIISGNWDGMLSDNQETYSIKLILDNYDTININSVGANYNIEYTTYTASNKNFSVSTSGEVSSTNVLPITSGMYSCGNSNYRWKGIYSTTAVNVSSDERLKENIKPINIDDAIKLVNDVNVKSFNYIGDDNIQVGIIAQDIVNASPELAEAIVSQGEDGYYGVKTSDIVFPLMAVTQNLMKKVEDLTRRVDELNGQ